MKTFILLVHLALAALAFTACNPVSHFMDTEEGETITIPAISQSEVAWYSDYQLQDMLWGIKVFYAGPDTLLFVEDPTVTYYSDKPIKSASVKIANFGNWYYIPCQYEVGGNRVQVYLDDIYEAVTTGGSLYLKDRIRFSVEAM